MAAEQEIQELQERRPALALAARRGDRQAERELAEVERRIAALARQRELDRLADAEQARLEAEAALQAERERVAALRAEQTRLEGELRRLAGEVDAALDVLVDRGAEFLRVADQIYHAALALGEHRPRLRRLDVLEHAVAWRLSSLGVAARPAAAFYRRRLAEILGEVQG